MNTAKNRLILLRQCIKKRESNKKINTSLLPKPTSQFYFSLQNNTDRSEINLNLKLLNFKSIISQLFQSAEKMPQTHSKYRSNVSDN